MQLISNTRSFGGAVASLPPGPFETVETGRGAEIPWYVIPFDEEGECTAPETREHLCDTLASGAFTDAFLFSHGWNNTWPVAVERYEEFIRGFIAQREAYSIPTPESYRPLLVGVFWPSTSLVPKDEHAPAMAGSGPDQAAELAVLLEAVDPEDRTRLSALFAADDPDQSALLELATILLPVYAPGRDEVPDDEPISPEDIVAMWMAGNADDPGAVDEEAAIAALKKPGSLAGPGQLEAAGKVGVKARDVIRYATIWRMKDRAAGVGGGGVARLLSDLLENSGTRMHLVGHSLGAKVMLSAVNGAAAANRNATSMLLLQPAVSHLCFAPKLPERNGAGGYVNVPDHVDLAITTTHSRNDFPLHKTFHLALRRRQDLGEQKVAAPGAPPSIHAALGGYGPRGRDDVTEYVDVKVPTDWYKLNPATRILSIDGTSEIRGHGDVSNRATWWMLHNLMLEGARQ